MRVAQGRVGEGLAVAVAVAVAVGSWPLKFPAKSDPSPALPCAARKGGGQSSGLTRRCQRQRQSQSQSQSPIPNPQSPIPNPQSPIPNPQSPIPNPESRIPQISSLLSPTETPSGPNRRSAIQPRPAWSRAIRVLARVP
ncbi:hypothetical protein EAT51_02280 [Pseudoxanthomonas winnipegensis]|nr:hypothetical protein EAT51_02280 [Pseudoxanthomonas winnipegensis]